MKPADLLTVEEVAARYRVTEATIRQWATSGQIPSMRTPGGRYRFVRTTLDDFDRRNQNDSERAS